MSYVDEFGHVIFPQLGKHIEQCPLKFPACQGALSNKTCRGCVEAMHGVKDTFMEDIR